MNTDMVKCLRSGKWVAKIQHPITKVWVLLGDYTTPDEAADACAKKKLHYQSRHSVHPGVKSGKWVAEIHNNDRVRLGSYNNPNGSQKIGSCSSTGRLRKVRHNLGTYVEDAQEAVIEQSDVSQRRSNRVAYQKSPGRWKAEIVNPISKGEVYLGTFGTAQEAEEAYNSKRLGFDLMGSTHKKRKRSNDGKSDSICVCNEPFVPADGCSVDFDLGIVDSYGQLVGEYSRLDDELWLC